MRLTPKDDARMNEFGYGLTDIVARATPNIDSLTTVEFVAGGVVLRNKIEQYAPCIACVVGVTGFRAAYNKKASLGEQSSPVWGKTKLFIVPSTSPRNAFYRPQVIDWFQKLKQFHDEIKTADDRPRAAEQKELF